MKHTPTITLDEQTTTGSVVIEITCCGDSRTAKRRTITNVHQLSNEQYQALVDEHAQNVATIHAKMIAGKVLRAGMNKKLQEYDL